MKEARELLTNHFVDAASREFKGMMDCFIKIAKHDGLFGLYR